MWRKCYSLIQNEKFCKSRLDEIVWVFQELVWNAISYTSWMMQSLPVVMF